MTRIQTLVVLAGTLACASCSESLHSAGDSAGDMASRADASLAPPVSESEDASAAPDAAAPIVESPRSMDAGMAPTESSRLMLTVSAGPLPLAPELAEAAELLFHPYGGRVYSTFVGREPGSDAHQIFVVERWDPWSGLWAPGVFGARHPLVEVGTGEGPSYSAVFEARNRFQSYFRLPDGRLRGAATLSVDAAPNEFEYLSGAQPVASVGADAWGFVHLIKINDHYLLKTEGGTSRVGNIRVCASMMFVTHNPSGSFSFFAYNETPFSDDGTCTPVDTRTVQIHDGVAGTIPFERLPPTTTSFEVSTELHSPSNMAAHATGGDHWLLLWSDVGIGLYFIESGGVVTRTSESENQYLERLEVRSTVLGSRLVVAQTAFDTTWGDPQLSLDIYDPFETNSVLDIDRDDVAALGSIVAMIGSPDGEQLLVGHHNAFDAGAPVYVTRVGIAETP